MSELIIRKRKRVDNPYVRPRRSVYKRRKVYTPGRDRVVGYYGRYAGRNAEMKFHDVDIDDATIPTAGAVQAGGSINVIVQGITESQRIGRKCTIKSVQWRYTVTLGGQDAGGTPQTGDTVRVILFWDKQANGATATPGTAADGLLQTADFQSFRNMANSGRFVFLLDRTMDLNPLNMASDGAGLVSNSSVEKSGTFYKKCSIPIEWSGTTGSIGETRSNTLGIMLISKVAKCDLVSKVRLRFSDN